MASSPSTPVRLAITFLCLAIGVPLLLLGLGMIPYAESDASAPGPIIALCGVLFVVAGVMVLVGMKSPLNDLLAALLCTIFGVVAGWIALYGADAGFSGGLPLLPRRTNLALARVVFCMGAIVCFAIAAWALLRYLRATRR